LKHQDIGKRIRARRKELQMTQEQLANETGMSPSFIGHIERGTRRVSLDTLTEISRVLDMQPAELISVGPTSIDTAAQHAYRIGDMPDTDISLREDDGDNDYLSSLDKEVRSAMLRELIELLDDQD